MNQLDTGKERIRKICEILKEETLEPAKVEAEQIVAEARSKAEAILKQAEEKKNELIQKGKAQVEKERALFETALAQAARQSVAALRQEIETQLFNKELSSWIQKVTSDPKVEAQLIEALVQAIDKEGVSADFSAYIAQKVSPEKVNAILGVEILNKLREKSVSVGQFFGGAQVVLHDKKITLDLSDGALVELMGQYMRKEFRKLAFPPLDRQQ